MTLSATLLTDPGCPWAYSAIPALTVLRWRYAEQLEWRLVMIGLTESGRQYEERGYTPEAVARGLRRFERYGMPFSFDVRPRMLGTARACRAIVAARMLDPGREWDVLRALQLAWFTTPLMLDEDDGLRSALGGVPGLDARAIVAAVDDPEVVAGYEADRAEARTAAGSPTELQGKAARTDGPVRYTAPSVVFTDGERRLEAGGFQPVEAYDVLIANLNPALRRSPPPEDPAALLGHFPEGLTTAEVAALLAAGNDPPDRATADRALGGLEACNVARRISLGDGALWTRAR